jgi:hypothetical protein
MKKITLILMVFVLIASACKKEEEEETNTLSPTAQQKGFAINYTATWCGHCGNWGAPLIHDYSTAASSGVTICAHSSDPMANSLYDSFKADRTTGGGIPSFWVGDIKTTDGGAMAALLGSGDAVAGVDYTYTIESGVMKISTKTEFFGAGTGEYYLSVLVLEDGIDGSSSAGQYTQSGTANSYPNDDYKHDFVLRASSVADNAYGEKITTDPAKGSTVEKEYSITVDASWSNPYAVAIIWNKVAGDAPQYKYINALKKK